MPDSRPLGDAPGSVVRAWLAIASLPLFLLAAFALGEGIISWLGYPVGGSNPVWVSLLSDLVVLVVLVVPCGAAVLLGLRARAAGVAAGVVPAVVGAVLFLAAVVVTVASEVGNVM